MSVKENRDLKKMFKNILDLDIESSKLPNYLTESDEAAPVFGGCDQRLADERLLLPQITYRELQPGTWQGNDGKRMLR
jgi:hypothetical protein